MRGRLRQAAVVAAAWALIIPAQAAAAAGLPSSIEGSSLVELAVTITGTGFGAVVDDSSPMQTCSTTSLQPCMFTYASPLASPTVTATAAPGSYFAGWGEIGSACGSTPTCTLHFNNAQSNYALLAVFNRIGQPRVGPTRHAHGHHHGCTNDPGFDASNDPGCPRSHLRRTVPATA